jgi:hypothetical protein
MGGPNFFLKKFLKARLQNEERRYGPVADGFLAPRAGGDAANGRIDLDGALGESIHRAGASDFVKEPSGSVGRKPTDGRKAGM